MARRRTSAPAETGDALQPPEKLMVCFVEDWVSSRWTPAEWQRQNIESFTDLVWTVKVHAWRRWRTARAEWLDQHGIPRERQGQLIPQSRPRFRDYAAFEADAADRFGTFGKKSNRR
ncbi:hypothetical protein [Streptosporangium sp. NBC_01756]|uniref:hypothetical protein n=1 Tax=Streptosporangium sp. NBC_01756 TaxID=2975950 RepID=UPI002DD7A96F|nr:hypothetical protein [Streptosporangium sp. NBC_01756]WSC90072.1 hypothetical protein OIE48_18390 [Streptosporangium sp. NBC_01756]